MIARWIDRLTAWVAAALGFVGCIPAPTAIPPPLESTTDAGVTVDGGLGVQITQDCTAACEAIDSAGCLVDTDCPRVICAINADQRFTWVNTPCLVKAQTPTDVAACGADCVLKTPSSVTNPQ